MTSQDHVTLSALTGTGVTVENATDDMRERKVTDRDGMDVGKVHDVFLDDRERKARFLLDERSGFLGMQAVGLTVAWPR
ncbi:PRC-barrel domain-containing protein [Mycobacterium sp. HUMS_1102779]|uniref:PRC-barrel domain-containing protein n=1 Tax=Mycobacterium sp. HUMS_1102779 TaxID=3383487 RepID=UPI00389984A9